jgi:KDO2-lipid IV(A) lauroyltransferase
MAMKFDRGNRQIAMRNLEIAFPDAPTSERLAILAAMYRNWGRMGAEWAHLLELSPTEIQNLVTYEGRSNWDRAAEVSNGRGILVMTGHFGNFELLPVAHAVYGTPIAIVHRPLRNPKLDAAVRERRTLFGNRVVARKGAGREVLRLLRDNWMVAVPMDLDVRHGVFVDFFRLKACTTDGLARLAMASGAPVLPAFMVRENGTMRHHIKILPHVELAADRDRRAAIQENTQRFTSVVEQIIRDHPDHWNWIHRRWKTRPPGESRFY